MKLHEKILQIMQEVEYLQKDDKVGEGRNAYRAITEEKVTETIRKSLIKNKVIILPFEQVHTRTDTPSVNYEGKPQIIRLATVDVKYKIIDVETGEFEVVPSSGTGVDTQDKAVGKAMTYAYKYMMLRTFAIPTGEDPDKISSDDFGKKNIPVLEPIEQPQEDTRPWLSEKQFTQAIQRMENGEDLLEELTTNFKMKKTYREQFEAIRELNEKLARHE
jgi:hypothetical protein